MASYFIANCTLLIAEWPEKLKKRAAFDSCRAALRAVLFRRSGPSQAAAAGGVAEQEGEAQEVDRTRRSHGERILL